MNKSPRINQYKCLIFLATLYVTLGICCPTLLGNKIISTHFAIISATSFAGPFWFVLGDVIAEIYGFKMALCVFWSETICEFFFILFCQLFLVLKVPMVWKEQNSYGYFFDYALKLQVFSTIGIIIAWHINTYLLMKWRILTKGRYFWLRSLGSSGIGIAIFSAMMLPVWFIGNLITSFQVAIELEIWACLLKICIIGFFSIPISIIIKVIKIIEHIDQKDNSINPLSPFVSKDQV